MRISKDKYFMAIAKVVALRSTCLRRAVGCVLVNDKGHIIGTGYNGVVAGQTHCSNSPCPSARFPSGTALDRCFAIHAEVNAVSQCLEVQEIYTAYVTTQPCVSCLKTLLTTSCQKVVFLEEYRGNTMELWEAAGRKHERIKNFMLDTLESKFFSDQRAAHADILISS